jgi:glucokinase
MANDFVLAADIGGSKASFTLLEKNAHLLLPTETLLVPFDKDGAAEIEDVVRLFAPFVEKAGHISGDFRAVGLSLCGNVMMETGEAILTPNLHWRYIPIGSLLSERYHVPVFVATDVYMAGLAELIWGKARGNRYFAWATIGTGFGGYLFLDGRPYGGYHGFAGNFGHNTIDDINGYLCGCGKKGCLETYAAGPAIARAGQKAVNEGRSRILADLAHGAAITSAMVFEAETKGDQSAKDIISDVVKKVAIGLSGLVNTLDLELIILGGGVVRGNPGIVDRIGVSIRPYLMTEEAKRDLRIEKESFDNSALIGAGVHAFQKLGLL